MIATLPRYHGFPVPSMMRALVMSTSYCPPAGRFVGTDAQANAKTIPRAYETLVILIRLVVLESRSQPTADRPRPLAGNRKWPLRNLLGLFLQEVHKDKLAQRHGIREVRLALTDLRHPLHEFHQRPVARQHEGVDQYPGPPAVGNLFQRRRDH